MKKITFSVAAKNLKKNACLLGSVVAALCLLLSPSRILLLAAAVIFAAVLAAAALDVAKPAVMPVGKAKLAGIILTVLVACLEFWLFRSAWLENDKAATLADALGMTVPVLLTVAGAVGCLAGAYAMYVLSCHLVSGASKLLKEWLPVREKAQLIANLKRNWFFPISAMAYFCLEFQYTVDYYVGLVIVFIGMIVLATQVRSMVSIVKGKPWYALLLIAASGVGICWSGQTRSYFIWSLSSTLRKLTAMLPFRADLPMCVSVFGAVSAFAFVFIGLTFFWTKLEQIFCSSDLKITGSKSLIVTCLGIAAVLLAGTAVVFLSTQAFYGTDVRCDLIYTSDSPMHLKNDVYLSLTYYENDLRQPLFAVFASPFMGLPYLLCRIPNLSDSVRAIIMNAGQIAILMMANYLLTKMLRLSVAKSVCFMVFLSCTYSQLLSVLMMEQYIVAYFWVILCLYLVTEKQKLNRLALWGAGGTLLTSMVLLPFLSDPPAVKNLKKWIRDMLKYGIEFVGLMLLLGRFDVFYNLSSKMELLNNFTGKTITLGDKVRQYLSFVHDCVVAPNAGIDTVTNEHISWQLNPVTGISILGVAVLVLIVVSVIWNRDKKSSLLAAGWVCFSAVMLVGLGWGTKENGLILYSLYFGWAVLVLLFQLVEKIESKLKVNFLIPVFTAGTVATLLAINIPAIVEMVNFGITYYPA